MSVQNFLLHGSRVHNHIFAPLFHTMERISNYLIWINVLTGFAFNKTFSHHMKKVIFFDGLDADSNQNTPAAEHMTLILHPTSSPIRILYQTLGYLYQKFK